MPLEFIHLDKNSPMLSPGDRGFIINLTKARWSTNASNEAIKLLRKFTQLYYEAKCPEEKEEPDDPQLAELQQLELEEGSGAVDKKDKSGIQFISREMTYPNIGFVACNLADPADFAHFVLTKLADRNDFKKPRLPFRILPVQRICEAKAKAVEQTLMPLLENTLGKDEFPYRFSLIYRGHSGGENLSHDEAKSVARNCIWALNPNCVQCIKYQDYAIVMDIMDPLFVVGIAKDFQKLASYNTWIIRHGIKSDLGTDSEDEISDDPMLSEEDERKRKLRIKRKRRAERAGLAQHEGEAKRVADDDSGEGREVNHEDREVDGEGEREVDGEEEEEENVEEDDEDNKADDVAGALNGEED